MAIDSKEKRLASAHSGRAWMRGSYTQSLNASQRAAIGLAYPVAGFSAPGGLSILDFERANVRGVFRGLSRGMT